MGARPAKQAFSHVIVQIGYAPRVLFVNFHVKDYTLKCVVGAG